MLKAAGITVVSLSHVLAEMNDWKCIIHEFWGCWVKAHGKDHGNWLGEQEEPTFCFAFTFRRFP